MVFYAFIILRVLELGFYGKVSENSTARTSLSLAPRGYMKVIASLILTLLTTPIVEKGFGASLVQVTLETREKLLESTQGEKYLKSPWAHRNAYNNALTPNNNQIRQGTNPVPPSPYPWRQRIMTTVFWIGEKPAKNNPVPNDKSSWDTRWMASYGGYDCPKNRIGFRPSNFIPKENPFYIALPYNDVGPRGTKPEASRVIPWFSREFRGSGKSVIKGRWIAVHYKGKVCFAQWEDVGPFRTDHWQYVFGTERPTPNRNKAAGLDVSPAVRDYLGLKGNDYTDWRFVEVHEVPYGPWTKYGVGNPLSPYYRNQEALTSKEKNPRQINNIHLASSQ